MRASKPCPPGNDRPCDLCGGAEFVPLAALDTGRALASGQRVVDGAVLGKEACARCGLARNTKAPDPERLLAHYRDEYAYNTQFGAAQEEHVFHEAGGPVPRSRMLYDWLVRLAGPELAAPGARILEIGCGQGNLLARLRQGAPNAVTLGTELNRKAAALATEKGLDVLCDDISSLPASGFDVVCSVGVIEHVPSPREFLLEARRLLAPGGICLTCQPCRDEDTPDLFFIDHLHHFGARHIAGFARATGFAHERAETGYRAIRAFSMHRLRRDGAPEAVPTAWAPDLDGLRSKVDRYLQVFRRVDEQLARDAGRRVAVFGLSTMFALLRAYTGLGEPGVVRLGLDDSWRRHQGMFPFPVRPPESLEQGTADVIYLCLHPHYGPLVRPRLEALGVHCFDCFEGLAH